MMMMPVLSLLLRFVAAEADLASKFCPGLRLHSSPLLLRSGLGGGA
jgi:hypothetical protein